MLHSASTRLTSTPLASILLALYLSVSVLIYIAAAGYRGERMGYFLSMGMFAPGLNGTSTGRLMRLREREVTGIEILSALEWI